MNSRGLIAATLCIAMCFLAAASSVAVVLQDTEGRRIGEVARHALSEKPR